MSANNKVHYYRVFCSVENTWKYVWGTENPTVCPDNIAHSLNTSLTSVVKTVSNLAKTTIDNRLEISNTVIPSNHRACFIGIADDIDNGVRGTGQVFKVNLADGASSPHTLTYQLADQCNIVGGILTVVGANTEDYCTMEIYAPASPVVVNGSGTGNCNVISGKIFPSATNTGTHDVNLTEALSVGLNGTNPLKPKLVSKVVPVPAFASDGVTPNGYYNLDDVTGAVTVSTPTKGEYNLFAIELTLIRYISKWSVYNGTSPYSHIFAITQHGGRIIPHWRFRCVVTRDASHSVGENVFYSWGLYISRQNTV